MSEHVPEICHVSECPGFLEIPTNFPQGSCKKTTFPRKDLWGSAVSPQILVGVLRILVRFLRDPCGILVGSLWDPCGGSGNSGKIPENDKSPEKVPEKSSKVPPSSGRCIDNYHLTFPTDFHVHSEIPCIISSDTSHLELPAHCLLFFGLASVI